MAVERVMLTSQRALFDIPSDVSYLNAAGWSPLPRATQEAAREAVARKGQPWKLARGLFRQAARARAHGCRCTDRRGCVRCRAGVVGRLRRRDCRQGAEDRARGARAGAGERPHLAGAGVDFARRCAGFHGRDDRAARRTATGPRPCWTRSRGRAPRRSRSPRSRPSTGRMARCSTWARSGTRYASTVRRCWPTPRTASA